VKNDGPELLEPVSQDFVNSFHRGAPTVDSSGEAPTTKTHAFLIDHPVATLDTAIVVTIRLWQTTFAVSCFNNTRLLRIFKIYERYSCSMMPVNDFV
jgi:hypothetical protein